MGVQNAKASASCVTLSPKGKLAILIFALSCLLCTKLSVRTRLDFIFEILHAFYTNFSTINPTFLVLIDTNSSGAVGR